MSGTGAWARPGSRGESCSCATPTGFCCTTRPRDSCLNKGLECLFVLFLMSICIFYVCRQGVESIECEGFDIGASIECVDAFVLRG